MILSIMSRQGKFILSVSGGANKEEISNLVNQYLSSNRDVTKIVTFLGEKGLTSELVEDSKISKLDATDIRFGGTYEDFCKLIKELFPDRRYSKESDAVWRLYHTLSDLGISLERIRQDVSNSKSLEILKNEEQRYIDEEKAAGNDVSDLPAVGELFCNTVALERILDFTSKVFWEQHTERYSPWWYKSGIEKARVIYGVERS